MVLNQLKLPRITSNLLDEFYNTSFCRTRSLEHEERSDERYKANKCDKMAYKTSRYITIFFLFCSLNLKNVQNIMLVTLYLANIRVGNAGK
jgi:hypothetical protein